MIGVVPLGVSELGGAEEEDSWEEVMIPMLLSAVLGEGWISTVAVEVFHVACIPSEVLIGSEGVLVTGAMLVVQLPVVISGS